MVSKRTTIAATTAGGLTLLSLITISLSSPGVVNLPQTSWLGLKTASSNSILGDYGYEYSVTKEDMSPQLMVVMADSRGPVVPTDPSVPIPFVTISAIINHQYAMAHGADFIFYKHNSPSTSTVFDHNRDRLRAELEEATGRVEKHKAAICRHPKLGWRAGSWCKLPAVWKAIQTYRGIKNFIYIDTDAVFITPKNHPQRHLDHLTKSRPIGFVSDQFWGKGPCAGYFFLNRSAEGFLRNWWDVELADRNLAGTFEQDALYKLLDHGVPDTEISLSNPSYWDRIVLLASEWQFEIKDPLQLIHHVSSQSHDRTYKIAEHWPEEFVPLTDRQGIQRMVDEIRIVDLDGSEVALEMEMENQLG